MTSGDGRVPALRIRTLNDRPIHSAGDFVLYWMTASRRMHSNFALQRAAELAVELQRPLLILEALRIDYPWASRRLHAFVLQGMRDNREAAARSGHRYLPYVEPAKGHGRGLIQALEGRAAVVVTDDFPCFFLPHMTSAIARRAGVRFESVDSNGLLPMRAADSVMPTAYAFRRFLQRALPGHLLQRPKVDPLADRGIPRTPIDLSGIEQRWASTTQELLDGDNRVLESLSIDHSVREGLMTGGPKAAKSCLQTFLESRLSRYGEHRNDPDDEAASGLSPWLHFGHISTHDIVDAVTRREDWSPDRLGDVRQTRGSKAGWWGLSADAEAFLDELVTWRELGFNMCWQRPDYDRYESLPEWAQTTLQEHAGDPRPWLYPLDQLRAAQTHDPLWNAAQTQLVREGRMHNYLRMLWGKKILEWSPSPQAALQAMIELNNRFAVDGRDPNSYSGIFWVLGRYDRPWGPERPVFGKIRYMTSENTARKLNVKGYLARYVGDDPRLKRLF
jgi:deoxyribodipyrimidine photo-lyase